MNLDSDYAKLAVEYARDLGAEYAEARLQRTSETGCLLKNSSLEPAIIVDAQGIGIRVRYNGSLSFAATNKITKGNIKKTVKDAIARAKASKNLIKEKIVFSKDKMIRTKWSAEEKQRIEDVDISQMIKLLKELDNIIKKGFRQVAFNNRFLVIETMLEEKIYFNSDGANIESRVPRVLFRSYVGASYKGKNYSITIPSGYAQLGETGGWEVASRLNLHHYVKENGSALADAIKSESRSPTNSCDLVLGPDVVGLVAHESAGHPGEADRILGREGAQAGESYLKSDSLGLKVGSEEAMVSDDPTIPKSMGFYLFDDEGVAAKKRRLIDRGLIKDLLHNRSSAHSFSVKSNASSRSVEYDREPIVRMANTFVEPGNYSFEELFEDIKEGVYIKSFMEWNIDDKRLNQRYVGMEAFLIKNGKIKSQIKNPVLEITTPKFWSSVDARSKDLHFQAATCGKGDPMQGAPVWTGGPHIRLRNIRLGAR